MRGAGAPLRAIVAYDAARAKPKAPGSVTLLVDGKPAGAAVAFTESTEGAVVLPDAAPLLTPGRHTLQLQMTGGSEMPYAIAVKLHSLTPSSSPECPLSLEVALSKTDLMEGDPAEMAAIVTNHGSDTVPTPVAIVGLPGGLEPRVDQLKELVKSGTIDAYEIRGREVVLYWRSLPAGAARRVPISVVAAVPGSYTGPASRAYLYYGDEHKVWVGGIEAAIAAR